MSGRPTNGPKKYFARTRKGTMSKGVFEVWFQQMETLHDTALKEYDRAQR